MTVVVHGYCPDCGRSTRGHREAPPLGAICYENPPFERVVACVCGSKRRPVMYQRKERV